MKSSRLKKTIFIGSAILLIAGLFVSGTTFATHKKTKPIQLRSIAFKNGGEIPIRYSYLEEGVPIGSENISIPLEWKVSKKIKPKVKSFALVMIDLHPEARKFVHWMLVNIPAGTKDLNESIFYGRTAPPPELKGVLELKNTYGFAGYGGPNPPPEHGRHVYEITLYALNVESLDVDATQALTWKAFRKLLKAKIVAQAKLKGKFAAPEDPAEVIYPVHEIEITSSGFSPSTLTVKKGDTVVFINRDNELHWPASDIHPTHTAYPETGGCIGSTFDACKGLKQGEAFSFIFSETGNFSYHDHLNPSVKGTVTSIVVE